MKRRGRGGGALEIEMYERENQSVMLSPMGGGGGTKSATSPR